MLAPWSRAKHSDLCCRQGVIAVTVLAMQVCQVVFVGQPNMAVVQSEYPTNFIASLFTYSKWFRYYLLSEWYLKYRLRLFDRSTSTIFTLNVAH